MRTCLLTHMLAHMTCIHICIHAYVHTDTQTDRQAARQEYVRICTHTHTYAQHCLIMPNNTRQTRLKPVTPALAMLYKYSDSLCTVTVYVCTISSTSTSSNQEHLITLQYNTVSYSEDRNGDIEKSNREVDKLAILQTNSFWTT